MFCFLTQIRRKYVIFVIPTKNKVICNSESIYIGRFLLMKFVVLLTFKILRHNDVITILY